MRQRTGEQVKDEIRAAERIHMHIVRLFIMRNGFVYNSIAWTSVI